MHIGVRRRQAVPNLRVDEVDSWEWPLRGHKVRCNIEKPRSHSTKSWTLDLHPTPSFSGSPSLLPYVGGSWFADNNKRVKTYSSKRLQGTLSISNEIYLWGYSFRLINEEWRRKRMTIYRDNVVFYLFFLLMSCPDLVDVLDQLSFHVTKGLEAGLFLKLGLRNWPISFGLFLVCNIFLLL